MLTKQILGHLDFPGKLIKKCKSWDSLPIRDSLNGNIISIRMIPTWVIFKPVQEKIGPGGHHMTRAFPSRDTVD